MADRPAGAGQRVGNGTSSSADARYRRLIDQSGLGLFQTDPAGHIRWVNDAAAKIVGFDSSQDFMGSVEDIRSIYVDPSRRDEFQEIIERDRAISDFEYEIIRRGGGTRWISVSAKAVEAPDGTVEAYEGTILDITDRKLIEAAATAISSQLDPLEAVQRFADVLARAVPFDQLTLAVIEGDHYRRIVSISKGPTSSLFPRGEVVPLAGNPSGAAVRDGGPVVVQDTSEDEWPFSQRLRDAGLGSYLILPLKDESGVFATFSIGMATKHAFTDDMTNLLLRHGAAVAQAVKNIIVYEGEREAVARLEELNRLKNEFFADVAHDLRNPLAVVSGLASVLESEWDRLEEDQRGQLLTSIIRNAHSLQDLLQRDLDIALIESGELRYELSPFDLTTVVRDVVAGFAGSLPDRSFDLSIATDLPQALGDERRHAQILQNLLSNALKFSPPGTTIHVTVEPRGDTKLAVSVVDEGAGIDEGKREQVFQRLSRLDSSAEGTGLGLYIARAMVEMQGGEISVDNEPGKGARFTYTTPIAE